ncbi:MAG: hypothetical protein QM648_02765 [Solirubrobacterales bacterium]
MGKRSRQRQQAAGGEKPSGEKPSLRQRADAASRVAEKQIKQRPKAPWDPFPLTELAVLSGLILMIVGAIMSGGTGKGLMASGVVLACIGGLDTVLREHLAGYRSHAGLLAGMAALLSLIVSSAIFTVSIPVRAAIAIGVFALVFPALRSNFIRRSGGQGVI